MLTYLTRNHFTVLLQLLIINFVFSAMPVHVMLGGNDIIKYECPSCKKVYKNKETLKRHVRFECGNQKPFSCPMCSYCAKQKFQVKTHMMRKHQELQLPLEWINWMSAKQIFMSNMSVNYVYCMNVNFKRKRCGYI